ncbi:MAG: hypothetical protein GXN97_04250 [Aquificae bacterium]|nr:hypothetical protein [Aquificota bacterium]
MQETLKEYENFIWKKLFNLFFDLVVSKEKRKTLYLGLCYCQISRLFGVDEIPLAELKKCLKKYLIDFDNYPWRDYLLEWEIFYLRDGERNFIKGKEILFYDPTPDSAFSIDSRYGFMKHTICQRIYKYWSFVERFKKSFPPQDSKEFFDTVVEIFNYGLPREAYLLLENYLPVIAKEDLLLYRVFRSLTQLGYLIESKDYPNADKELEVLLNLLDEYKGYLKPYPYDFHKLEKDLNRMSKYLENPRSKLYPPLLKVFKKKPKQGFFKRFFSFFRKTN